MSSLEVTLNDFVTKIPQAQADVSWEQIVEAFYLSSSSVIAIVDQDFHPLGILESHKILTLITHNSISGEVPAEPRPRSFFKSRIPSQEPNLKDLISRITTLSSQIKIRDLVALLNNQEFLISEKNYLIVNETNEVAGILDIPKLLKYLAKGHYTAVAHQLDRPSLKTHLEDISKNTFSILFELLEQIKLPLMLHNAEGQICYQNTAWDHHPHGQQATLLMDFKRQNKISTTEDPILQPVIFSSTAEFQKSAHSTECYCPIENQEFPSPLINSQIPNIINSVPHKIAWGNHDQNSLDNFADPIVERNYPTTQNDIQGLNWNYWQFPIQLPIQDRQKTFDKQSFAEYWLVIGTQLSLSAMVKNPHDPQILNLNNNLGGLMESKVSAIQPSSDLNKLRRLQDEFMVNISHDLKSPLTAIIGLSSLLKEEKLGSLTSRQIRYLDLIYRSGRQLMGIVTDLLDITSLATGKLKLQWENIELEKFCRQIYQQVVNKLEAVQEPRQTKPLVLPQFKFALEPEAAFVIADRLRLSQILTRLLENALKSTPGAGEIGIRIEQWTEWIAIIVWDTGRGISETFQKSLLEEMFEPDNFLASPERTTGLELILAQQLAQSHGGDISFTSQVDHGSEFTLLLPVNNSEVKGNSSQADRNYSEPSSLVLIIETSAAMIEELSENLKRLGYHAAIARNQNEALYKASHLQPVKIILNNEMMKLPQQNILAALKSDAQTRDIPVILMAQNYSPGDTQSAIAEQVMLLSGNKINPQILAQHFPSLKSQNYCQGKRLTILRLCLTDKESSLANSEIDLLFESPSFNFCHHIIEADSLEQASMLARIWQIDTIIWDSSNLKLPLESLRSLVTFPDLAQIPIVTLDGSTTAAANQFEALTVFPCLIPINENNIAELMEVIQSAATAIDN
ncbi:signal transduction histidine kinase [Xenococcus sp. PCC 7305]|uniref:ATP-binding response regulator n=1 Tax=Xenococcus sp. PCC 7305 TaxID=102125 RepID=UPI0002ABFDB0|nr:hybrid sensor histidine kinase/response regulator [Xenococcus sp. PCC 7305]ELS02627.1 signal transduction histidine kinase [Xenococcus sp. PCC 7305]